MYYNFDKEINRKNTYDLKWNKNMVEGSLNTKIREDFIPMWIADTDFACPPHLVEAMQVRASKEIYGYCAPMAPFYAAVCWWERERFNWETEPEQILVLPSVVSGINIGIRTFSDEGDGVIIQPPVYDPFSTIVKNTGRKIVANPLRCVNGLYEVDFELFRKQAEEPFNKVFVLCSPHNPVGRVWSEEELRKMADICLENNVMIISDEIHSDIVHDGHTHKPLLSLDNKYAQSFIYITSPSKSFNVPGLKTAVAIIPNARIRSSFETTQIAMSLNIRNTFGMEGVISAYTPKGEEWLKQELDYLQNNVNSVEDFIRENLPKIKMISPEGTFLCWLDCSGLGYPDEELFRRVNLEAGVICVPGTWFGEGGHQHIRLNVGCTHTILMQALQRIKEVL